MKKINAQILRIFKKKCTDGDITVKLTEPNGNKWEKEIRFFLMKLINNSQLFIAATPGNSFPSKYSNNAPPPVDT